MKYLSTIFFISVLLSSTEHNNNTTQKLNDPFFDSLRLRSHSVRILFFMDFSHSKASFVAKQIITESGLDTLFTYIGDKKDSSCHLFSHCSPAGEIYFYGDSLMQHDILDLYFTLNGSCAGFSVGPNANAAKYNFTKFGNRSLVNFKKKLMISQSNEPPIIMNNFFLLANRPPTKARAVIIIS